MFSQQIPSHVRSTEWKQELRHSCPWHQNQHLNFQSVRARGAVIACAVFIAAAFEATTFSQAFAQEFSPCGGLLNVGAYGPFDYRTATDFDRRLVEGAHFTPDVANLRRGATTHVIGADIDYTLRAFPNHPRALMSMSALGLKTKSAKPPGAKWTVDCYFDRAIRWRPDDPKVRLVYGIHLTRNGQKDAARTQLAIAEENALDESGYRYNLGLALLDIGESDRALIQAWRAYALGYDLPGLKDRLQKLGKWRDPEK